MANQIGMLDQGRLRRWDTGFDLYNEPADRVVADFIGQGVLIPAQVLDAPRLETEPGTLGAPCPNGLAPDSRAHMLLREDELVHGDGSDVKAKVLARTFHGAEYLYEPRSPGGTEILRLTRSHDNHMPDERFGVRPDPVHLVAFPGNARCPATPHPDCNPAGR